MELNILKEIEQPLLNRKRYTINAEFPEKTTPSKVQLIEEIAKKIKTKPETVFIKHIYNRYGAASAKVVSHVYKSAKDLKEIECVKEAATGDKKENVEKKEAPEVNDNGKKESKE